MRLIRSMSAAVDPTRAIAGDPELPAGLVRPTDGMLTFIITERTATAL